MNFKQAYERLISSELFKKWRSNNPGFYLSHVFSKLDKNFEPLEWEAGFYSKDSERITVFSIGEKIEQKPSDEVFKKEGHPKLLEIKKVETLYHGTGGYI